MKNKIIGAILFLAAIVLFGYNFFVFPEKIELYLLDHHLVDTVNLALDTIMITCIVMGVVVFTKDERQQITRTRRGLCPKCGYDLRATPDRCPECGTATPTRPSSS